MYWRKIQAILIAMTFCILATVSVAVQAEMVFTVNNQGTVGFKGNWTLGYEFTANTEMTVESLGFFDRDQDGLSQSHDVAIWDSAGNILASATVNPADPLVGFFRYTNISPLILDAGQNYVVGAYDFTPDDAIRSDLGGLDLTVSSDITMVTGRWRRGSAISFPTNTVTSSIYYPVANFQYSVTNVPEPLSLMLTVVGFGCVYLKRRDCQV